MGPCAFTKPPIFEPLDYYNAPFYLKPPCKLRELPNELLAAIAHHLRNRDLCSLALVSTQLRAIAQETLIRPVKLPRNSIRKLLETLINRPDLADRICHVDLGDFNYDQFGTNGEGPGNFNPKTYQSYADLITKQFGSNTWEEIARTSEGDNWNGRSYYLALLALMLPNLKRMTFEMRAIADPPQNLSLMPTQTQLALQTLQSPFCGTVMQLLAHKLERLTVADQSLRKGPHMHNLDFSRLTKLRRLSIPLAVLIRKNSLVSDLEKVLPSSLEYLQLRHCNKFVYDLVTSLASRSLSLPVLRKVALFFKSNIPAAVLISSDGAPERINTIRGYLSQLLDQGIHVTAFVQPYPWSRFWRDLYLEGNFKQEVELTSILSPEEIYMASTKNTAFSSIVARDEFGKPRMRMKFERRLMAKFWNMPLRLFTSPTFEAVKWSGIRMFNASKDTGNHQNDRSTVSKAVPPKDCYGKPKKEQGVVASMSIFKKEKQTKHTWAVSPTFDSASWCKVKFFLKKEDVDYEKPAFTKGKSSLPDSPRRRKMSSTTDDKTGEVVELARAWKI